MARIYCKMTKNTYELKAGTKGAYELVDCNVSEITETEYNNITSKDTLSFFRRLGGSETATKCYTSKGYNVYRLISKSPDRQTKVVRTFDFDV